MANLEGRLQRLESVRAHQGPLLVSWKVDGAGRATAAHDGCLAAQGQHESRDEFFARVSQEFGSAPVVWISEEDWML